MFIVIRAFFDSTDDNRLYKVGDAYPAEGVKPSKKRIEELAKGTNCNGKIYIDEVTDNTEADGKNDPQNPEK